MRHAYGNADGDAHIHPDGDRDGNCHIHAYGDCDSNCHIHADSNCHIHADSNCHIHADGDCDSHTNGNCYGNCECLAAAFTDAQTSSHAGASPVKWQIAVIFSCAAGRTPGCVPP